MATKKCPYCAEEIQEEAIICRYCKSNLGKPASQNSNPISNAPFSAINENKYIPQSQQFLSKKTPNKKRIIIPVMITVAIIAVIAAIIIIPTMIGLKTDHASKINEPYGTPVLSYLGDTFEDIVKEYGRDREVLSDNSIRYKDGDYYAVFFSEGANINMILLSPANPISNRFDDKLDMTMSFNNIKEIYGDAELLYNEEENYYYTELYLSSDGGLFSDYCVSFRYTTDSKTDLPVQAYVFSASGAIAMNPYENINEAEITNTTTAKTTAPVTTTVKTTTTTTSAPVRDEALYSALKAFSDESLSNVTYTDFSGEIIEIKRSLGYAGNYVIESIKEIEVYDTFYYELYAHNVSGNYYDMFYIKKGTNEILTSGEFLLIQEKPSDGLKTSGYNLYLYQNFSGDNPEYNPTIEIYDDGTFRFYCNHYNGMATYWGYYNCIEEYDSVKFKLSVEAYEYDGELWEISDSDVKNTDIFITWYEDLNFASYEDTSTERLLVFGASSPNSIFEAVNYY